MLTKAHRTELITRLVADELKMDPTANRKEVRANFAIMTDLEIIEEAETLALPF